MVLDYKVKSHLEQVFVEDGDFMTCLTMRLEITSAYATQNTRGNNDEIHIVVYDTEGDLSGFSVDANGNRTNAVLETYPNLSVNPNAKSPQGDSIYYPNVIFKDHYSYTGWITMLMD